jgi:hypothetical protein
MSPLLKVLNIAMKVLAGRCQSEVIFGDRGAARNKGFAGRWIAVFFSLVIFDTVEGGVAS